MWSPTSSGSTRSWAASVNAGLAGTPTRVLATFDPAAHPPLMIEPMRALPPREVFEQFVASNDDFLGALVPLDDAGWSTVAESPPGHVSIRLVAQHALWDAWVHERDIAIPLGLGVVEVGDEVASCLRYAAVVGPVLTIAAGQPVLGTFGVAPTDVGSSFVVTIDESVEVRNTAPTAGTPCLCGPSAQLVEGLSVRAPLPADVPPEWRSLVGLLATVFDAPVIRTGVSRASPRCRAHAGSRVAREDAPTCAAGAYFSFKYRSHLRGRLKPSVARPGPHHGWGLVRLTGCRPMRSQRGGLSSSTSISSSERLSVCPPSMPLNPDLSSANGRRVGRWSKVGQALVDRADTPSRRRCASLPCPRGACHSGRHRTTRISAATAASSVCSSSAGMR